MNTPRQTNLLNPALRQTEDWLSPKRMAIVVAAVFSCVLISCAVSLWIQAKSQQHVNEIKDQVTNIRIQIGALEPQANGEKNILESEIKMVSEKINRSRELMSVLGHSSDIYGDSKVNRHSDLLEALARIDQKSLWLTKIEFNPQSRSLGLLGKTTDSNIIGAYIQNLTQQAEFSGLTFDQLDVHIDSKDQNLWVFSIGAQPSKDVEMIAASSVAQAKSLLAQPGLKK